LFSTHKTGYGKKDVSNEYQNSGVYVSEIIDNLNTIRIEEKEDLWNFILSQYYDKEYTIPISSTFDPDGNNLNFRDLYYFVIEKMMKFPVDYFDGLLAPYRNPEINHNDVFELFVNTIFKNIYLSKNDPIDVVTTGTYSPPEDLEAPGGSNYLDEAIEIINEGTYDGGTELPEGGSEDLRDLIIDYTEKILILIGGLQNLFSSEAYMQWSLSLKDQEEATLSFVQTAIEIFLSYTTELYYTTYKKKYDSQSEIFPLFEKINHRLESNKMEMVFYDEKLNIELLEGDE
jgi:hypothetical protein